MFVVIIKVGQQRAAHTFKLWCEGCNLTVMMRLQHTDNLQVLKPSLPLPKKKKKINKKQIINAMA